MFLELKTFLQTQELSFDVIDDYRPTVVLPKKKKLTSFLQPAILTAACCLLIFIIAATEVKGNGIIHIVINNVQKQIGFRREAIFPDNTPIEKLVLPSDFSLINRVEMNDEISNLTKFYYSNNSGEELTLSIEEFKKKAVTKTESEGDAKIFEYNNQVYYTASDKENNLITWNKQNYYYILYGNISLERLQEIIINTNGG